jgi:hypothetical protein
MRFGNAEKLMRGGSAGWGLGPIPNPVAAAGSQMDTKIYQSNLINLEIHLVGFAPMIVSHPE